MSRGSIPRLLIGAVTAAAYGALCGVLLGISQTAYIAVSVLAILGGYVAGYEHHGWREGALRGVIGGALFGLAILAVHELTGKAAKADLPHPGILLAVATTVFGALLGALGGSARANKLRRGADTPAFDLSRIGASELIGFAGSAVLVFGMLLPWFATSCERRGVPPGCNQFSRYHGQYGDFTAFQTFKILDWLLLAAATAPFILAWIILRGHELTWQPGEVTMIVGMTAFVLILLNGIVLGRPGDTVDMSIEYGYVVSLVGAAGIGASGLIRQGKGGRKRKPPGTV